MARFSGRRVGWLKRLPLRAALCALGVGLSLGACAARAAPTVVVSIAPVHALVSAVMDGVATPTLLVPVGASPHAYALRPSQRRIIAAARVLIWVGPGLEPFLRKPIGELADSVAVIELLAQAGVQASPMRSAGVLAPRAHDGHEARRDDDGRHVHRQGDPHVWLDPDNAIAIVGLVAAALAEADPPAAHRYAGNARAMIERIRALERRIDALLVDVREVPYIVFHDAYQGFERRFGLRPLAALSESPAKVPGTRRVLEIRQQLRDAGVRCVFAEPQYPSRLLDALIEGLDVRRGILDPLGHATGPGENGWLALMLKLATSLHTCLSAD